MCTSTIWLEAITFLCQLCFSIIEPGIKIHIYESICVASNYSNCSTLAENTELEDELQHHAAKYIVYMRLLRTLPALLIVIFCGAWSDSIGRKLPLLFPFIGTLLSLVMFLVSYAEAVETLPMVLVGSTLSGLFGEVSLVLMAANSYVTDVTETHERTKRLGRLMAASFFGQFVGAMTAAIMIKLTIVRNVFILALIINVLSIAIIIMFLKESLKNKTAGIIQCQVNYLADTWYVISKRREHRKRAYICIILLCIALHQACVSGELDVAMLYVRHRPLKWNSSGYGYYVAGGFLCSGLGTLVLLPILSVRFHVTDIALIMAAIGFKVVQLSWTAFAVEAWMVYFGLPPMVVSAMFVPALKSVLSKLISSDEVGRIFGLSAIGETLSAMLGALLFTAVYGESVRFFHGFAFILEALVSIGVFGGILWLSSEFHKFHPQLIFGEDQTKLAQSSQHPPDDDVRIREDFDFNLDLEHSAHSSRKSALEDNSGSSEYDDSNSDQAERCSLRSEIGQPTSTLVTES